MAKTIDYAAMYTLRKDGMYMGYWRDERGRHAIYDRDPESLHRRIAEREAPKEKTFSDIADEWERTHVSGLNRGSQATYKAPLQQIKDELGDKLVREITPLDVQRIMLEEKAHGYSYKHAALKKSIIKQILDSAVVSGLIQVNPSASVTVPRGMKRGRVEAPEKDVQAIISENLHQPFGDFVAVLLYTGMRTEEAAALRWGDIETKAGKIHVHAAVDLHGTPILKETKTESGERTVPILPQLRPYLKKPRGAKPDSFVFNCGGALLTRGQISSRWLSWCKAAGLAEQVTFENRHRGSKECTRTEWRPLVNPHQLRHNYATVLYEQDVDELTAQKIMGHKDISTTRKIYTTIHDDHMAKEVRKIAKGF